ncbi:MAG: class I SAM-dependent methyltransferase [Endozoicomonas sp.]
MNPAQDASITGSPVIKKTRKTISWLEKRLKKAGVSRIEMHFGEMDKFKVGCHHPDIAVPTLHINNPIKVLKQSGKGLLGWAEAYMADDWSTPDLYQVMNWAMANENPLEQAFTQKSVFLMIHRLLHWLNRNNKRGSRRNIAAHYDLGNDFYQLWLDSTMTYSSALFKNDNDSLGKAQNHKYQTIIDWLELDDQHSILEIGCGWGGVGPCAGRQIPEPVPRHYSVKTAAELCPTTLPVPIP